MTFPHLLVKAYPPRTVCETAEGFTSEEGDQEDWNAAQESSGRLSGRVKTLYGIPDDWQAIFRGLRVGFAWIKTTDLSPSTS